MLNESWHCLDLITMDFPWKTSSWWQYTIYLYNPSICLHVNSTFAHMPVPHAVCSAAPPYHDRRLLLLLSQMKVWMVPVVFGTGNSKSIFPGNKLKCGLIWVQHTFPLFLTIWDELWPRETGRIDVYLSLRVTEFQVAFLDAAADCGKWQWFSEVLLSPCGYI